MFINYSNHSSQFWSAAQVEAAHCFGNVYDVQFPDVSVDDTKEDIRKLSEEQIKILEETARQEGKTLNQTTIMCQGEFSLTYAIVSGLKRMYPECRVVCAVSKRDVVETQKGEVTEKKVVFSFCGFREYI